MPYTVCFRCGRSGHRGSVCFLFFLIFSYSLKECIVDVYKKPKFKSPSKVSCYNCGSKGHTGPVCFLTCIKIIILIIGM